MNQKWLKKKHINQGPLTQQQIEDEIIRKQLKLIKINIERERLGLPLCVQVDGISLSTHLPKEMVPPRAKGKKKRKRDGIERKIKAWTTLMSNLSIIEDRTEEQQSQLNRLIELLNQHSPS